METDTLNDETTHLSLSHGLVEGCQSDYTPGRRWQDCFSGTWTGHEKRWAETDSWNLSTKCP